MESSKKKILLTGISGFVGSQLAYYILTQHSAKYQVRGTVRSLQNEAKMAPLRTAFGEHFSKVEYVEADLFKPETIVNAMQGVDYILHVASPISGGNTKYKYQEYLNAVESSISNILKGAQEHKVKKVVITSSALVCTGYLFKPDNPVYDENDTAPIKGLDGYIASKIIEEEHCQRFIKEQEAAGDAVHKVEVVILNPSFILGPTFMTDANSSSQVIRALMNSEFPGVPDCIWPAVDIRDVCYAQVKALETKGLHGQRILITKENLSLQTMQKVLLERFDGQGFNIQRKRMGACSVKFASFFISDAKFLAPFIGRQYEVKNDKSKKLFGMTYEIPIEQSIIDLAESCVKLGIVPSPKLRK